MIASCSLGIIFREPLSEIFVIVELQTLNDTRPVEARPSIIAMLGVRKEESLR